MTDNARLRQLLDEMLDSQATPEDVCSSCPELLPEVRARWQRVCRVQAELDALFPAPSEQGASRRALLPEGAALPQIPGYEVEAVLGRGGMGVVYRARHLALKRTVALKMLAAGHSHPADRARFKAEAEAVARLQHPNIVQIHEIGEAAVGPFFALEFVAGGSLARRLAGRPLPPRDAARLVAALADAMHLAHSRNLVHRDLKPANVLLAGEADAPVGQCQPKVTDFGLVRQLDADSGRTQVGVAVGTPSYMAPEQAEGRAHAAGPAADVYALGAILYECLTGQPPFRGATQLETLDQVRHCEPAAPSSLNRWVPRDLETVCLKCLRKQPERRYSSARELADDLGRFVRGEPVLARPVGVVESLQRWVWRRPAAAGMLAAGVLLVATGAVGAWLLYQQRADARARQAQTDQEVRGDLERARGLLEEGWQAADLAKLAEASSEAHRAAAVARSGGASAAVRQEAETFREGASGRLRRAQKDRVLLAALRDVSVPHETLAYVHDQASWPIVLAQPSADAEYAAAFRRWGLDVNGTAEAEVVARLALEPDAVVQELIAALDGWMLERLRNRPGADWRRLFRVAEQLDGSARRRRLRSLLVSGAPPRAESAAGLVGVGSPWPALWEVARGSAWRALLELRREIDPRIEPVPTVVLLAYACADVGDAAGAEQVLRQAVTARPEEAVLLAALGKLLERQGDSRRADAIGYYRAARSRSRHLGLALSKALFLAGKPGEAEEVLRELALQPEHDHNPALSFYLGAALWGQRKYGEAEAAYREAIRLKPDWGEAHGNLAAALNSQRRYGEAETACRKAIDLQPADAAAFTNLGDALVHLGKPGDAAAACRKALDLKPDSAEAYVNLGNALDGQGKDAAAEAAYRKALRLRPDLGEAHYNLGNMRLHQKRYAEAEAAYRKALDLRPDLAEAHNNLGEALLAQKRYAEAEAAVRKAADLRPDLAEAHNNLGGALLAQKRYAEAEAAVRKATDLKPNWAEADCQLGHALYRQQKYGQAEAACRKALDLKPDYAEAHVNLGNALDGQGKGAEAEAAYRKALDLRPDLAEAHNNLGNVRVRQQRYAEAEAAYRKATGLRPDLGEAHYNLGNVWLRQQRYAEAEAAYRKALDLRPDLAEAHNNLGEALLAQKKYGEAEAAYRKATDVKPDFALAYRNLGLALLGQGQFAEAAAPLKRAEDLSATTSPLREQARQLQRQCQRFVTLDARLPAILQETEKAANALEQLELARLCLFKKHYAAAARFSRDAFAADPKLADMMLASLRYDAAGAAALAGRGHGKDADKLDDQERARWRRQAREWLRQDLGWWGRALDSRNEKSKVRVRQEMQRWQADNDLAGLRERNALEALSPDERKECLALWQEVAALLGRAQTPR
jgi:serine/threonine-protein kinase